MHLYYIPILESYMGIGQEWKISHNFDRILYNRSLKQFERDILETLIRNIMSLSQTN